MKQLKKSKFIPVRLQKTCTQYKNKNLKRMYNTSAFYKQNGEEKMLLITYDQYAGEDIDGDKIR